MRLRLTREADRHIGAILRDTLRLFGAEQVRGYASILSAGLDLIAADRLRPASLARDEIHRGLRSFHLELVRRRRRSASNVLFYLVASGADGDAEILVIGVLHESMEPRRRLGQALRGIEGAGAVE